MAKTGMRHANCHPSGTRRLTRDASPNGRWESRWIPIFLCRSHPGRGTVHGVNILQPYNCTQ